MSEPDQNNGHSEDTRHAEWIALGIAVGVGLGSILGVLLDNIAIGIAIGIGIGVAIGNGLYAAKHGDGTDPLEE